MRKWIGPVVCECLHMLLAQSISDNHYTVIVSGLCGPALVQVGANKSMLY